MRCVVGGRGGRAWWAGAEAHATRARVCMCVCLHAGARRVGGDRRGAAATVAAAGRAGWPQRRGPIALEHVHTRTGSDGTLTYTSTHARVQVARLHCGITSGATHGRGDACSVSEHELQLEVPHGVQYPSSHAHTRYSYSECYACEYSGSEFRSHGSRHAIGAGAQVAQAAAALRAAPRRLAAERAPRLPLRRPDVFRGAVQQAGTVHARTVARCVYVCARVCVLANPPCSDEPAHVPTAHARPHARQAASRCAGQLNTSVALPERLALCER